MAVAAKTLKEYKAVLSTVIPAVTSISRNQTTLKIEIDGHIDFGQIQEIGDTIPELIGLFPYPQLEYSNGITTIYMNKLKANYVKDFSDLLAESVVDTNEQVYYEDIMQEINKYISSGHTLVTTLHVLINGNEGVFDDL